MVMKNGDVYFTTLVTNADREVRMKTNGKLVPNVPVKIDALCGQEIRGNLLATVTRFLNNFFIKQMEPFNDPIW